MRKAKSVEVKLRLLHRLARAGRAEYEAGHVHFPEGAKLRCSDALLRELESAGLLKRNGRAVQPLPEVKAWLRRQRLSEDAFANQHRIVALDAGGIARNLLETPLRALCIGQPAFLAPHHQVVAERLLRWADRARLAPRVTTSYGTAHIANASRQNPDPAAISDMTIEARQHLSHIYGLVPHDCAEVVVDVCVFEKGMQQIETERGWPRRSAKLVLRIGLDQLARHYGLAPQAEGQAQGTHRSWQDAGARPTMVG